jgi:hypothetical protein
LIPIIPSDSDEMQNNKVGASLCKIFYQPAGYQWTAKKLHESAKQAGYNISLDEMQDWLVHQAVHQIYIPCPKYISHVSFTSVLIPNEVYQADVLYMLYDKIGCVTYLFCLNVMDVVSRYKASVPIGSTSIKNWKRIFNIWYYCSCL